MSEDFLSRRQQLTLEEHYLKQGTEAWIRLVNEAGETFSFIGTAIDECIFDETVFLVEPGNLKNYWHRYSTAPIVDVQAEQHRLFELREEQKSAAPQYMYLMLTMWMKLKERSESPRLNGLVCLDEDFWEDYAAARCMALYIPLANRLMLLSFIENHIWMHPNVSLSSYDEWLDSLDKRGRGKPPDHELYARRKALVVRLLIEEKRSYTSRDDFYFDLAFEDPDWHERCNKGAVRSYFKGRLPYPIPKTLAAWSEVANWWHRELEVGVDTGWIPSPTGRVNRLTNYIRKN